MESHAGPIMPEIEPAYLNLLRSGELEQRVRQAIERLSHCETCAWECDVDRRSNKLGICKTGMIARVSSYGPHMGEEDPLRGWRGSGTIFFSRCNLHCQFCQNHDISQTDNGTLVSAEEIAVMMLELQAAGCHNINLVSPSHVVPHILAALLIAARAGLRLPLVYNTGGYDSLATLQLLDGIIDIYMPDMKFASAQIARYYSKIPKYPQVNQAAVLEMHRQVGDLHIDRQGIATRGLLVRHLVLPNNLAGTQEIVLFLAQVVSPHTYLNLMDQYQPAFKAALYPRINRLIKTDEYRQAILSALEAGLYRLDDPRAHLWVTT